MCPQGPFLSFFEDVVLISWCNFFFRCSFVWSPWLRKNLDRQGHSQRIWREFHSSGCLYSDRQVVRGKPKISFSRIFLSNETATVYYIHRWNRWVWSILEVKGVWIKDSSVAWLCFRFAASLSRLARPRGHRHDESAVHVAVGWPGNWSRLHRDCHGCHQQTRRYWQSHFKTNACYIPH